MTHQPAVLGCRAAYCCKGRLPACSVVRPPSLPPLTTPAELDELLAAVGRTIAKLHDGGLVHGDLTTSNMMLRTADKQLVRSVG